MTNRRSETEWPPVQPKKKSLEKANQHVFEGITEYVRMYSKDPDVLGALAHMDASFLRMSIRDEGEKTEKFLPPGEEKQYRISLSLNGILQKIHDSFRMTLRSEITVPHEAAHELLNRQQQRTRRVLASALVRSYVERESNEESHGEEEDGGIFPDWRSSLSLGDSPFVFDAIALQEFYEKIREGRL